jgi:hypothetical protein
VTYHDGHLLILGGEDLEIVEQYNSDTNTWSNSRIRLPHVLCYHRAMHLPVKPRVLPRRDSDEEREERDEEREEYDERRVEWEAMLRNRDGVID